jgi:protein LSM14
METVERALGDLRGGTSSGGGRGGGRRGHGRHAETKEIKVPATDFDFQGSNAKFDKSAAAPRKNGKDADEGEAGPSDDAKEKEEKAYNPHSSFFDSLSSSTQAAQPTRGGGRRGGGPGGRNRREEERERNVATFGEPGGVGLMGPGAYVGGWGGYGRRGTRPRRGAPPVATSR